MNCHLADILLSSSRKSSCLFEKNAFSLGLPAVNVFMFTPASDSHSVDPSNNKEDGKRCKSCHLCRTLLVDSLRSGCHRELGNCQLCTVVFDGSPPHTRAHTPPKSSLASSSFVPQALLPDVLRPFQCHFPYDLSENPCYSICVHSLIFKLNLLVCL